MADLEEAGGFVQGIADAAEEGGAIFLLVFFGGLGGGAELRDVLFEGFDELLDGEVEDVGFGVCFYIVSFLTCF